MNGQLAILLFLSSSCFSHPMSPAMRSGRISRWRPFNLVDPEALPLKMKPMAQEDEEMTNNGPRYPPMLRGNEKMEFEDIPKNVHELEGFMDDIKSKLRNEITALLTLEDDAITEEAAPESFPQIWPGAHRKLFDSSSFEEKRRFVPAQLLV